MLVMKSFVSEALMILLWTFFVDFWHSKGSRSLRYVVLFGAAIEWRRDDSIIRQRPETPGKSKCFASNNRWCATQSRVGAAAGSQ
jgi:hypothetical protein